MCFISGTLALRTLAYVNNAFPAQNEGEAQRKMLSSSAMTSLERQECLSNAMEKKHAVWFSHQSALLPPQKDGPLESYRPVNETKNLKCLYMSQHLSIPSPRVALESGTFSKVLWRYSSWEMPARKKSSPDEESHART